MRFAKRRADWRLGRWTAKHALSVCLDLPAHPEIFKKNGHPPGAVWRARSFLRQPASRSFISLSHRTGVAACAVAMSDAEIGCDLEMVEPRSDALSPTISLAKNKPSWRALLRRTAHGLWPCCGAGKKARSKRSQPGFGSTPDASSLTLSMRPSTSMAGAHCGFVTPVVPSSTAGGNSRTI